MPARLITAAVFAVAWIAINVGTSQGANFTDITGVWTGTYNAAFPKGHGHFAEERKGIQMELRIVRQDENLFWAENRWRLNDKDEWHSEHGTGTFSLHDPTILYIVEESPKPEIGSTGFFEGKLIGEKLYLIYKGVGRGISFAAVLKRK